MNDVRCVADTKNHVGESPVWDTRLQRLYWTDINGMQVYSMDRRSGAIARWKFNATVSALALTDKPERLLVAEGLRLLLWDVGTDERVFFAQVEDADTGNRLNDGAVDPDGNLWLGTMRNNVASDGSNIEVDWNNPKNRSGSLYRVSGDGTALRFDSGLAIPNTMVWSPDRSTMYTGDSIGNVLYAYDYAGGFIAGRRVLTQGFQRGVPDGSAMDEHGFIWNCRYFGHCIVRFTPTGEVDRVLEMPVTNVTNCAFGGEDLRTLFVTTAAGPSHEEPLAGNLFSVEVGVAGLPDNLFHIG